MLEGAIRGTGRAALAVPGGTTPAAFLDRRSAGMRARLGGRGGDPHRRALRPFRPSALEPAPAGRRRCFAGPARAAPLRGARRRAGAVRPPAARRLRAGHGRGPAHRLALPRRRPICSTRFRRTARRPSVRLRVPGAPEPRITLTAPALSGAAAVLPADPRRRPSAPRSTGRGLRAARRRPRCGWSSTGRTRSPSTGRPEATLSGELRCH